MLYINEMNSKVMLLQSKYVMMPKGHRDAYTGARTDFADIAKEDIKHPHVVDFVAKKRIRPAIDADFKDEETTPEVATEVVTEEVVDSKVVAAGEGLTITPIENTDSTVAPDLTASITGEPMVADKVAEATEEVAANAQGEVTEPSVEETTVEETTVEEATVEESPVKDAPANKRTRKPRKK